MPKGKPNKRYTVDFKQKVVEDMINNHMSYNETKIKYDIISGETIQRWERIYLEEGAEGLSIERRGRACCASGTVKGRPPKLAKKKEDDLIAEVQRLRIENEYLKKLHALVQQREQKEKKKHW